MRVRRDMSSIPHRSAGETWQRIIDLVTGPGSKDVQQLKDAAGVMGSIITDEHPASRAIMVEGVGAATAYLLPVRHEGRRGRQQRGFPDLESHGGRLDDACALRCREYRTG